ncbi:hypothetical protein BDV32DRAFT_154554 [Aspergillus pseudonomiae]|uniref:Uncharacterized protein n=1 Tax=Aspergillus pseudonomiae TaxID=1506151 RepID=A0A5N6HP43_9EURO|nr:uncharacterized protein BDV37DRAFT_289291 [Aspergillus pseudonomiae]KAB8255140.1 hypothetical protein BDV32DRAFT_154554 [Aspergillus pseudonomiae]KAE8397589.1 hypothetical protein BDV37DRAFT_289291 [Aspergillus pseudonomiae]
MTSLTPMPFLTGPAITASREHFRSQEPVGDLTAVIALSKVQQALWLDYLRRPHASHYHLTLFLNLEELNPTLDNILQVIHALGQQHEMLRTTFHLDHRSDDINQSYMAVHSPVGSFQKFEIVQDPDCVSSTLRRSFDLSTEFPVRWVILQKMSAENGILRTHYDLYIVGHHIAVDGSSMSYLSQRILQQLDPKPNSSLDTEALPNSPTYGQFVQKQDAFLRGQSMKAAQEFWMSQLTHTVPFEWAAPKPSDSKDYRVMNTWASFTNQELKAWSSLYKTSWFRIAFSIVGLLTSGIAKPTPHHDHTLLVALGGRPQGYEACVSHMANTMPIRTPVSSLLQRRATFVDAVKEMGRSISTAKKHEMFPFVSLVETARETMSDKMLDFKVSVTFSPKLADDNCTIYPVEGVWDLFFCFLETQNGVDLGVISNPAVFDAVAIETMRKQFMETVKLSQENPNFPVDELPYLQAHTAANIISGPTIDAVDAISSSRVHTWIEARSAAQPDAVALSCAERNQQMTYGELDRATNKIAHYLCDKGIAAGETVAVHIDRGFTLLLWIIGILKAGGCFVVVDKALPTSRRQSILRTCEPAYLVTDTATADELLSHVDKTPSVIVLDALFEGELASYPLTHCNGQATADNDLAYMVFTSGSTGQPKGIMVEHANVAHYVSAARSLVHIGPGSRVLQFASFAFDASILEWAVTLTYGATLCFVEHPSLLVGDYLADVLDTNRINFFHTTPSVLATIPISKPLPNLRLISVGGEASSAGLLRAWRRKVNLLHAYGPTETTVIVTSEPIPEDPESSESPSPSVIGKPFPNSDVVICSEGSDVPLPIGETGEICIFGPQVSRGYKGQDELTATKFRTIELHGRTGRLYRSGDRGSLTADGKVLIGGRMNNREIKLRGYRMDLYEIEKSILDHSPEVMLVSVQVMDGSLVAFVTPETVDCNIVRGRLMEDVPSYSVPTNIHAVAELPLNTNGKVDHSAVAEKVRIPTAVVSKAGSLPTTPKTPTTKVKERKLDADQVRVSLASIVSLMWADVLGLSEPPAEDVNFFDAGGHSILLVQLHKRINERFPGAGVRLLDCFQQTTIAKQAAFLAGLVNFESSPPSTSSTDMGPSPSASGTSTPTSSVGSFNRLDEKFAVVGLAGRFPGADNVEQYWNLLMDRGDGITTAPNAAAHGDFDIDTDEVFVPRYGTINGLDDFNPGDWGLSEEEAKTLDPQKRIFLNVASEALIDAGVELFKKEENKVGVFIGAAANSYIHDPNTPAPCSAFKRRYRTLLDENISTFTSYKLNLTGPNVTLNTACASSLVALHVGLNALRGGECEAVLIGGTSVVYPQEGGYITSPGQVFSASGECRPFDSRSDGSVPSDAVAAVVVKPLHAAVRDGNTVYSVIEGHAVGTDGAIDKAGFTVPSSTGQARTIEHAIQSSGISAETIKYVEMHGSGTSMGDALELDGLRKAFDSVSVPHGSRVYVGSNKGNCGNSETASGLMSVIKASLSLARGVVPPLRELGETNPSCDFTGRFRPLTSALKLDAADRIGVTSLGYGGTNAHIILAPPAQNRAGPMN